MCDLVKMVLSRVTQSGVQCVFLSLLGSCAVMW